MIRIIPLFCRSFVGESSQRLLSCSLTLLAVCNYLHVGRSAAMPIKSYKICLLCVDRGLMGICWTFGVPGPHELFRIDFAFVQYHALSGRVGMHALDSFSQMPKLTSSSVIVCSFAFFPRKHLARSQVSRVCCVSSILHRVCYVLLLPSGNLYFFLCVPSRTARCPDSICNSRDSHRRCLIPILPVIATRLPFAALSQHPLDSSSWQCAASRPTPTAGDPTRLRRSRQFDIQEA